MQVELVIPPGTSKPRSKMFPVLVFLLMACYGIMAMVLVEQGNVIQSQRNLIQQLFQDSQQLVALRSQNFAQHAIEKKHAEEQKPGQPSAKSAPAPNAGKPCRSCGAQMQKHQDQRNMVDKQPLQAVDKADKRRFASTI
jgi:hypothetical protein